MEDRLCNILLRCCALLRFSSPYRSHATLATVVSEALRQLGQFLTPFSRVVIERQISQLLRSAPAISTSLWHQFVFSRVSREPQFRSDFSCESQGRIT